jgi:nucleotide-binding universal stress UspA family protein
MWQEEADAATRSAHDLLAQAGLPHKVEVQIGDPAQEITQYAKVHECDEIVMGTRGLGTLRNLILGSVAYKVVHLTDKPVLLVK